jgi:hypothetical protein
MAHSDLDNSGSYLFSYNLLFFLCNLNTLLFFQEELREQKLKAKDDAEDLTQEMAELRYQITGMLEEEYKRRSCIEQAAIQHIQELEAQVLIWIFLKHCVIASEKYSCRIF